MCGGGRGCCVDTGGGVLGRRGGLGRDDALRPVVYFFFSSRRRHTRFDCDWSSDVCSSDLKVKGGGAATRPQRFQTLDHLLRRRELARSSRTGLVPVQPKDRYSITSSASARADRKSVV